MASTTLMRDLQDARALAHKIWLECHNGRTQYHCLAVDARSMRNALEDIEEATSSPGTISAEHATKLQDAVTSCSSALCILEFSLFALQRSRHSFNFSKGLGVLRNLKPVAVATLQKTLLFATVEAHSAFEALSAKICTSSNDDESASAVFPVESRSQLNTVQASAYPSRASNLVETRASVGDSPHTSDARVLTGMTSAEMTAHQVSTQPSSPTTQAKKIGPPVGPKRKDLPFSNRKTEVARDDSELKSDPKDVDPSPLAQQAPSTQQDSPEASACDCSPIGQAVVDLTDILKTLKTLKPVTTERTCSSALKTSSSDDERRVSIQNNPEPSVRDPGTNLTGSSDDAKQPQELPALHGASTASLTCSIGTAGDLKNEEQVELRSHNHGQALLDTAGCSPQICDSNADVTKNPDAPQSLLVQRLKSARRAPTSTAQDPSQNIRITSEPAFCYEQQVTRSLGTVDRGSRKSTRCSLSVEDLYTSSRPTTPRVSAESVLAEERVPDCKPQRSSIAQPGLEVDQRSDEEKASPQLSFRHSEDELLDLRTPPGYDPSQTDPISGPISAATPTVSSPQPSRRPPPPPPLPPRLDLVTHLPEKDYSAFRGSDNVRASQQDAFHGVITEERVSRICRCWNNQLWPQAEGYLAEELESHLRTDRTQEARRARHLLGVCATLQGHWQRALVLFVSVISPAIDNLSDLDPADCAALWFLGDTYAVLDRRAEALLAYCLALQGYTLSGNAPHAITQCLRFDQQNVKISRADFRSQWDAMTDSGTTSTDDTILNNRIFSQAVVKRCFDAMAPDVTRTQLGSATNRSRVSMLHQYDGHKAGSVYASEYCSFQHIAITPQMFEADGAWPFKYDPMFCIANVALRRLVERPCDLLEYISRNPGLDFTRPRAGVWGLSRRTRFKCVELLWLVGAVRACLEVMGIEWTESAGPDTSGLCIFARHSLLSSKVATVDFFTISLFRHSLHSKYSVAICPNGIRSARINTGAKQPGNAVRLSKKRLEKFVYRYLKAAYAQRATIDVNLQAPTVARNSSEEMPGKPSTVANGIAEPLEPSTILAASESFKDKTTMLVIQPIGLGADKRKRSTAARPFIAKPSREVRLPVRA